MTTKIAYQNKTKKKGRKEQKKATVFLLCWSLVILFLYSLSSSKLIPYIIPVFPPLAVLMGRLLHRTVSEENWKGMKRFLLWNSILLIPFILALLVYPFFNSRISAEKLLPYSLPVAAALSAFTTAGWYFFRKRRFRLLAVSLCLLSFLVMFSFKRVFSLYDGLLSARELAGAVAELRRPGDDPRHHADQASRRAQSRGREDRGQARRETGGQGQERQISRDLTFPKPHAASVRLFCAPARASRATQSIR